MERPPASAFWIPMRRKRACSSLHQGPILKQQTGHCHPLSSLAESTLYWFQEKERADFVTDMPHFFPSCFPSSTSNALKAKVKRKQRTVDTVSLLPGLLGPWEAQSSSCPAGLSACGAASLLVTVTLTLSPDITHWGCHDPRQGHPPFPVSISFPPHSQISVLFVLLFVFC